MNFNSDYQNNQNRLRDGEVANLSLDLMKTKTKSSYFNVVRVFFEILFVVCAVGIGYMQGLKSFNSYTINTSTTSAVPVYTTSKALPENHQENIQDQL